MYVNRGADIIPVIYPFSGAGFHVNTTMTHDMTEIMMPVGAVDRIIARKPRYIWNVWQIISGSMHSGRAVFAVDVKLTGWGSKSWSSG